jgi:act minimal PKS acyl carrier protein
MSEFDVAQVKEIMLASAGAPEGGELDGDISDVEFADLGYDSLAVLELCSQVERRYGITISDDALGEMPTPARAVEYVNLLIEKARV